jgi:hypothetical protein
MSDNDVMDSILKYILTDVRGFLLLCPIMLGVQDRRFLRPRAGGAYLLWEAPGHT